MGVLTGCKPSEEVLRGDLNDAIFAADFGEVIAGNAPDVYGDAELFFRNTHPTQPRPRSSVWPQNHRPGHSPTAVPSSSGPDINLKRREREP